ncbi:MAG: hypothetical protein EBZ69_00415 [Alphaproteobacteria bacterium]|nr:hypothetical protein [Alphaproteobacteria bacterium]
MAKKIGAGRFDSPGNLWGKPLGRPTGKPVEEEVTGMRSDDSDSMEEEELDVDAELADADEQEDNIDDDDVNEDDSDAVAEDDVEDDEVDDDGLTYAPEAGDAPAEEKVVVSAVDTDEVDEEETADDEELSAEPTESRIRNMADKKKVSLSDHIRNEIDKRKAAGTSLRGVDIVAALEKRGINVSAAQVSQLLKKAGLGGKPRKRAAAAAEPAAAGSEKTRAAEKAKKRDVAPPNKPRAGRPAATPEPRAAAKLPAKANGFKVPMAQLQAAEAFVDACGGSFKDAERILVAASQLSQTFGG